MRHRFWHWLGMVALLFATLGSSWAAANSDLRPENATRGSLLMRGETGYLPAPTLSTSVEIDVTAMISRVRVSQRFRNPSSEWAEGVYVFPLPEDSAVDHMRMEIGERVIEGEIKERGEAKRIYNAAKQQGKRASLLEQERPNIFTTSVANIAPGEEIRVVIEYQQTLSYRDGGFSLRYPMAITPRYIPGNALPISETVPAFDGLGWAPATDQVADASRITPPVRTPEEPLGDPVTLRINFTPGFPVTALQSAYHPVKIERAGSDRYTIELAEGAVAADRDFELSWRPAPGREPKAALFTEQLQGESYALLMLMPPGERQLAQFSVPRDVTYVIDTSGSMGGESIRQARAALLTALGRLNGGDRFNIIEFNSTTHALFPRPVDATPANLGQARRYVTGLQANGGTEMRAALLEALGGSRGGNRLHQVVFITDGAVGNEDALFALIRDRLGRSRLFTVGIGPAPNSHFMTKAAQFGRGSYLYIGQTSEVQARVEQLVQKLQYPALTDINLEMPEGSGVELLPNPIPDLYLNEPLQVVLKGKGGLPRQIVVSGRFGDRPWKSRIELNGGSVRPGISVAWGRSKIAQLMDRHRSTGNVQEQEQLRQEVVDTALRHHLVSRFTSLVAVDRTPARSLDQQLKRHAMKGNLPQGLQHEKFFGLAKTATPAQLQMVVGLLLLLAALIGYRIERRGRQ